MKKKLITTILLGAFLLIGSWSFVNHSRESALKPNVMENNIVQPRYKNINTTRSSLVLDGAAADVSAYLTCRTSSNITITMKLQKKINGSWSTIKTWTDSYQGIYGNLEQSYTLTSKGSYRVSSSFKAGSDTFTHTSSESIY